MLNELNESNVRNEDSRGGSSSLLDSIGNRRKDWLVQMRSTSFLGVCSTDNVCTYRAISRNVVKLREVTRFFRLP